MGQRICLTYFRALFLQSAVPGWMDQGIAEPITVSISSKLLNLGLHQHRRAYLQVTVEALNILVSHPHTAMGDGGTDGFFLIGAVDADVVAILF